MAQVELRDESIRCDQQLSGAEFSTDVVSNVQLGGVRLYVVLIMFCTGRDWGYIKLENRNTLRFFFYTYSPKSDARLVVLMMVVLGFLLDTNDVVVEAGDATDVDVTSSRSSKGASETGTLSSCAGVARCDSEHST